MALELHDLRAEDVCAEACVPVGVGSAELVVDVERRDAIAEQAEHVPEAGRVGAARNETGDLTARGNQLVLTDEPLDAIAELLHPSIVPRRQAIGR